MAISIGYNRIAAIGGMILAALLAVSAPAAAVPTSKFPVYTIDDYPFQKAPALMRWRSVQAREAEMMARAKPEECKAGQPRLACAAKEALLLEEKLKDLSPVEQVEAVYAYFNKVKWKEHAPDCGVDCWKTRLEFLADREGDCGDHALAEYFTLKRLGFQERDLQLIVAQLPGFADSFKGGHVVLRVRAEGEYFILDNRRTDLTDLSGLHKYKVLAGVNADSVQIYNLVTPTPPPGYVADATQVAALITSPGAAPVEADVQVAEATPETEAAPAQPTLVAAVTPAEGGAAVGKAAEAATFEDDSDMACMQSANLADWNPFLPCTPTKQMKIVVKPKIVIGAEPPKPAAPAPSQPVVVATAEPEAAAPKAANALKTEAPKFEKPQIVAKTIIGAEPPKSGLEPNAAKPKIVAKTVIGAEPPKAAPQPVAAAEETEAADDTGSCTQGATLADWNPDLPCAGDGNASTLRIENND